MALFVEVTDLNLSAGSKLPNVMLHHFPLQVDLKYYAIGKLRSTFVWYSAQPDNWWRYFQGQNVQSTLSAGAVGSKAMQLFCIQLYYSMVQFNSIPFIKKNHTEILSKCYKQYSVMLQKYALIPNPLGFEDDPRVKKIYEF